MQPPQETLDAAISRAAEITWWNRGMTKLNEIDGVTNAQSFVADETVEQKGPFVEFVDAPAFHEQTASEFLAGLDYDDAIVDAITAELFGGDPNGSLYQHQAETIEAIERTNKDNVLAVPTASGKTEAFFLPILNYCLSTDEEGLKSIVLYPMKTLGVDQLNRFLTYLDHINRYREPEDRITIGIWDSDTPTRVGTREHEIEEGSYVRGLVDPRNQDEKLRVLNNTTVGTDDNAYSWVKVTRDAIRQGVDILLTVPEALDYMFVSNNEETRDVLGNRPSEQPLKHIVYDEAHVWSGIQGAAVSLLSQRLKSFYSAHDPQVTMVSATIDNPEGLACSLTGSEPDEINTVEFTGREFQAANEPDFSRLSPCDLDELVQAMAVVALDVSNPDATITSHELERAVETLRTVGLLEPDALRPAPGTEWAFAPIRETADGLLGSDEFDTPDDIVTSVAGRNRLTEVVIDRSGFSSGWYDFVLESVPEVPAFTEWFERETTGEVGFREYAGLVEEAADLGVDDPAGTLETVMSFGRLAGIVTEKYHSFLKPPARVHWCRDCERLTRDNRCPTCGQQLPEVQFCRNGNCHEPYVEGDLEVEESEFVPARGGSAEKGCPGCGKSPNLRDIEVPTSSLLSYMLTEVCRVTPSKKTLVFSDSHSAAESVGDQIIKTEYGLVAQTLYLQELLEAGGQADRYELYSDVADQLRAEYWQPLIQNDLDEDGQAYNFLVSLRDDIEAHAYLSNCRALLEGALVTADVVADYSDPVKLAIAHALYKRFILTDASFQYEGVKIDGLTRSKILDRLDSDLEIGRLRIDDVLDDVLTRFVDAGVLSMQAHESFQQSVDRAGADDETRERIRDFLATAREEVEHAGIVEEPAESGVFTRNIQRDQTDLVLIESAAFCEECYASTPATADGKAVDVCQDCGEPVEVYRRFSTAADGSIRVDPGFADVDSGWEYAIDHWAHDVTRPLQDGGEPEFYTVGIHKGNIPHTLRGAIEEGFRKDDPTVNIVSSTPTMELGVDIGSLETVAQVGVPPTLTNYVQRSGRTGRSRGSSSLVMTVIRGQHPVDGHYYANLDSYLGGFEPVRVPDPYDFDELLAGQVVTEVFAYLARNPHETNVLDKMYSIPEPELENLSKFVNGVEERLDILTEFVRDEMADVLREYIRGIFGPKGVEVFEAVFFGDGPLSISRRTEQTFSRLKGVSSGATTNRDLTSRTSRLDQWLDRLGYLANYRNFGQTFPVKFSGRREEISFEASGRLYDMYPGEENDLGAAITLHGTDYMVKDVRGSPRPLTEVAICDNEECDRRFRSYGADEGTCPYCESELELTKVHAVANVECKVAQGGQRNYRTYAQMSTHVRAADETPQERHETQLFGLPCDVAYGQYELTDFVYAFERSHTLSSGTEVLRSEALIEQDDEGGSTAGGSWRERMSETESEIYRPVGQQHHTQGICLQFDRDDFADRYADLDVATKSWPQVLTSLEQALERAIAVVAECDRSDFRVKTAVSTETVEVYVVDSRRGGNGISWRVHESLAEVADHVADTADCDRCVDYCDECLLLSRTPGHYLENDLLNHRTLAGIIGVGDA